jgi:hypothetical protein
VYQYLSQFGGQTQPHHHAQKLDFIHLVAISISAFIHIYVSLMSP